MFLGQRETMVVIPFQIFYNKFNNWSKIVYNRVHIGFSLYVTELSDYRKIL